MASSSAEATTIHSSKYSSMGLAGEMEVEAYRRLFPLPFYERHLQESVRPDARPLSRSRETSVALGPVATADGSALVKIGETFWYDRLKGTFLISGKAAWMAYLDIYCLNADGSLFDAALLSAIAAFSHLQIPLVSVNDDGRVIAVSGELKDESKLKLVNKEKRKLSLGSIPFSLTCMLHKKYIFVDPTAEEESIMETTVTVVLDSLGRLVSVYKAGGSVLAYHSTLQECIALTKRRVEELREILEESLSAMEVD